MAALDAHGPDRAVIEWENEGGALRLAAGRIQSTPPADFGRSLAILGALMAVWPDLSVDVRARVALGAMVALSPAKPEFDGRP
jgi:hypothetical protein